MPGEIYLAFAEVLGFFEILLEEDFAHLELLGEPEDSFLLGI